MKQILVSLFLFVAIGATLLLLRPPAAAQGGGGQSPLISQVSVVRNFTRTTYAVESSEEQVGLDTNETASVNIQLSTKDNTVLVRAPQGGLIDGEREVELTPDESGNIAFTFDPQDDAGVFYIEVSDSQRIEVATEFRVGPQPEQGEPGPDLTFN